MAFSKRFRLFIGQCLWVGVSVAFWSGLLTPIMTLSLEEFTQNEQLEKTLYALAVLGIGEITGGYFMGLIVDKTSSRIGCVFNILSIIIACGLTYLQLRRNSYDWLTFLMCFMWGISDAFVNTHSNQMMGFEFETNSDPFGVFNAAQSISVVII